MARGSDKFAIRGWLLWLGLALILAFPLELDLATVQRHSCPRDAFLAGAAGGVLLLKFLPAVVLAFVLGRILAGIVLSRIASPDARAIGARYRRLYPRGLVAAAAVAIPLSGAFALTGACAWPGGVSWRATTFAAPTLYRWDEVERITADCRKSHGGDLVHVALIMTDGESFLLPVSSRALQEDWAQLGRTLDRVRFTYDLHGVEPSCSAGTRAILEHAPTEAPSEGQGAD